MHQYTKINYCCINVNNIVCPDKKNVQNASIFNKTERHNRKMEHPHFVVIAEIK